MAFSKVVYGNDTIMDITDTTATASDVAAGKIMYTSDGTRTVGIASPGIPAGGSEGEVLTKASSSDYDAVWSSLGDVAVEDIVPVPKGGTGATSASAANASLHNYNLLEGVQIPYNTNLNTIVTPNIYRTINDSNTASLVNKPPVTQPFQLAVMYINGDYTVMQHVNEWLTGNEWRRFGYISGGSWTWGAWHKISESFPLSVGSGGTGATSGANALANLGVIEAFSAGNGSLKLPNGTLIQWGATTLDVANALTQIATSGVYYGPATLPFPIAFADTNYYLSGTIRYATGYAVPCGFLPSSSTSAYIGIYDFYARPASSSDYKLYWFAIGRWA